MIETMTTGAGVINAAENFDIRLCDPQSKTPVAFHYAPSRAEDIRAIYGLTGAASVPVLEQAIRRLSDATAHWRADNADTYAKRALRGLLLLAQLRPDGVWEGE
jgi:hypothetical protein